MRIAVHVVPRARRTHVDEVGPLTYRVAVTAPAHDNEANVAAIDALAAHFGVPPSHVRIVAGRRARRKIVDLPSERERGTDHSGPGPQVAGSGRRRPARPP